MNTKTIRILIVDDHDLLRKGFAICLNVYPGLTLVGEAANGAEAIEEAKRLHPDVILMDLKMPEVDGVTAIRVIRSQMPDIKIIAFSSASESDLVEAAFEAGTTSYLMKTVTADQLANAIRSAAKGFTP